MRIKDDSKIKNILKIVSPGTNLREGLENILRAKTGGLIVLSDNEEVMKLVDGGFYINSEYSPAYIYELAKMDGAIVLSEDVKTILLANAQLIPDYSISTSETGTRHRTAERVAKQTGAIVISISQRRNIITVYRGEQKYVVEEISKIFTKANQALQTLEKYKKVFDNKLNILNEYEFNDIVTLENVIVAIQRAEMVMNVADEVQKSIYELGEDGRLLEMQLEELIGDLEVEELLMVKDYLVPTKRKKPEVVLEEIKNSLEKGTDLYEIAYKRYLGSLIGVYKRL